jgi:hypothetical protein
MESRSESRRKIAGPPVVVQVRLRGPGAVSWSDLRIDFALIKPRGDADPLLESGYSLQPAGDSEIDLRPGTYDVKAIMGGVLVGEAKGLEVTPGSEPCLILDCVGIDWATMAKGAECTKKGGSILKDYIGRMSKANEDERQAIKEEFNSKRASNADELRLIQAEFDKSPPARLLLRHRVDDF